MPTPLPVGRLPALKAALERFTDDDRASQKDLAELYGVAPSRLSTLVKTRFTGFPAAEKRGDKTHWYPARAAIQVMIDYIQGTTAAAQAQAKRHTEVMAGAQPAREEAEAIDAEADKPMSASEIDKLITAQTKMWKLAKDQGLYVLADDVRRRARQAYSLFTRSITAIPARIDPNGKLPVEVRTAVDKACRQITAEVQDAMMEMMGANDEAVEPAGRRSRTDEDQRGRRSSRRG